MEPENKIHIIATVMTGRGLNDGFKGEEWYARRIPIFKKFTIENLRNQTNKNFLHWIMFRPEEKQKKLTRELLRYLDNINYRYVATFYGQCWWDDKVDNSTLKDRLAKSLKKLNLPKTDYVYLTQLDSDDMLRFDIVNLIQQEPFGYRKALYHKKGYVYNHITEQLADWYVPSSWESFTLIYPYEVFMDAKKNLEYQNGWTTHEEVPVKFNAKELPENSYIVSTGNMNRSTQWGHPYMGNQYFYESEKIDILRNFICQQESM